MREEHTERLSTDLTREQRLNLAATQQKPEMEIYGCRKFEDRDNVDGIGQKHYEEHHIHKRYWRRGFAKEAARAVRDWAFLNTEYHELYSYMKYTNEGSWRTALANGMKKVKEYPDPKNTISYAFSITREEWMRQQRFDCTFDDLSVDNELNQILKATAIALIRCPEVDLKRKQELRQEMLFFSSVADIDASHMQWGRLLFHRNNRSYEMLMNICQMVWASLLPSMEQGSKKFSLFDEESMPHLYEKFILEYYRQHFPSLHASDKAVQWDIPDDTDPGMIRLLPGMHTDITLRNHGKTLIIDAKYYQNSLLSNMGKQMLRSAHLYQIYTYVKNEDRAHTGNVSGMLLYARTTEEIEPWLSVPIGGNQISVRSLDLNRPFAEIADSLDRIAYESFGDTLKRIA